MEEKRSVIITGAASGIGAGMAEVFAEAGYRVAIADLSQEAAEAKAKELGPEHLGIQADVTSEEDVKRLAETVNGSFGRIDALINNAGIGDTHLPTLEQEVSHFRKVLDVHLTGTFLCCREVGRFMVARGDGAIVNVSSIAGLGGLPKRNAYGAAKAGIIAMTKSLAGEWACHGVRVNAIAPGYVETALVKKIIEAGRLDKERLAARTPMARLGTPHEIARAALFLASPEASYVTGAILSVDGGWNAFGDAGATFTPAASG